ncbi:PaaI family thioesterase [Alloalcanivorax sp. C16-1]|uniref:PaaI family thioesterase n=1 Tax=Alloalcanivorax sp. C16-1 TaxID=3390051 RepID=UPI0039707D39
MTSIPEGFQPHTRKSGFTAPWEPIYHRPHDNGISLGLRAGDAHANSRGFVHGGLLSALCDNAMGLSCVPHLVDAKGLVTVNLNLDFLGSARVDQWLEFRAEVTRVGRSLSFASATVLADGAPCARATGVFKVQR